MSRKLIPINQDWYFEEYPQQITAPFSVGGETVTLPHTWNADGGRNYHRGACLYTRELKLDQSLAGSKLYIEFLGANSVCEVFLNNQLVGTHRGGYSTFRFELTELYDWNRRNILAVIVDNSETEDVSPLFGDFTIYGGLYREVNLVAVGDCHFDLMYYGTLGVLVRTEMKDSRKARIHLECHIRGEQAESVHYYLYNSQGQEVINKAVPATEPVTVIELAKPECWNGKARPVLYRLKAVLCRGDIVFDTVEMNCGFRFFSMTANDGMYLNGRRLPLHGVGIHQDYDGLGNAVGRELREQDFKLMDELGINMIRLTHYQHAPYLYDMCDRDGYVVWSEIPLLSLTENPALLENACRQLRELVLQNCHHPSIFFWGLQNEIAMFGENRYMYEAVDKLNRLAKHLDPTRLTTGANLHNVEAASRMNRITDMVGYNLYYGWYYGEISDYQNFLEEFHKVNPQIPLGISEYGVDCNLSFHSDAPKRKDYSEEFQCLFHQQAYAIMENNPWIWGNVIWNMFDFGSAIRDEGGTQGKNAKGLVTFDRKIRKDAFFFYKACWGTERFVHITGRRYQKHWQDQITIPVYSNLSVVSLYVNGELFRTLTGDRIFRFDNICLLAGENKIKAVSGGFFDEITLIKVPDPVPEYTYIDPNPGFNVKNWFLTDSDELSTKQVYSLWDTVGDLQQNPLCWQLLKENLPELWADPTFEKRVNYVLFKLINRSSGKFDEQRVKKVNEKLMEVKKR